MFWIQAYWWLFSKVGFWCVIFLENANFEKCTRRRMIFGNFCWLACMKGLLCVYTGAQKAHPDDSISCVHILRMPRWFFGLKNSPAEFAGIFQKKTDPKKVIFAKKCFGKAKSTFFAIFSRPPKRLLYSMANRKRYILISKEECLSKSFF